MRAILAAETHPDTAHVSAQRCSSFAAALARRGHQVVLMTQTLTPDDPGADPSNLPGALAHHDWSRPFHVACERRRSAVAEAVRRGRLPALVRRPLSGFQLLREGPSPEWSTGAARYVAPLVASFRPQVAWAVFGSVSDLRVGQSIARAANCPYVIDFKDNWDKFIPALLRAPVARRFIDAAAFTANAEYHAEIAGKWFEGAQPEVVYSGVAPEMTSAPQVAPRRDVFQIALMGGLYEIGVLRRFIDGVARWLGALAPDERQRVELVYAGGDQAKFAKVTRDLDCRVRSERYLPLRELGVICRGSAVNCYIWSPLTFHHKLLELLACNRPVVSFPGERAESVRLAARFRGDLRPCGDGDALVQALAGIWKDWRGASPGKGEGGVDPEDLSWDAFALGLERVLANAADEAARLKAA